MKRFSYLVALLLAGAALMAPSAAAADYTAYVGCSSTSDAAPATSCVLGDSPGAFFRSESAAVKYGVCVDFPSGDRLCSEEQEASQGTLYANKITTGLLGTHDVTWSVSGTVVAAWRFELLPASPPASPPVTPVAPPVVSAPVAATSQPAPPSPECSREKQRVKRLLAKLSQAQGKEAKAKVRPKLKAARAAAKRLCSAT